MRPVRRWSDTGGAGAVDDDGVILADHCVEGDPYPLLPAEVPGELDEGTVQAAIRGYHGEPFNDGRNDHLFQRPLPHQDLSRGLAGDGVHADEKGGVALSVVVPQQCFWPDSARIAARVTAVVVLPSSPPR